MTGTVTRSGNPVAEKEHTSKPFKLQSLNPIWRIRPLEFTIQYNTIRYDTTRYDTTRHGTTRHDTTRHDTTRHDTIRYDTKRYDTIRYDTIRYDTIRYDTIRYDTIQYNTTSFISHIEHNYITTAILPNIGMVGKGVDRRIILSWSTPNID